MMIPPPLLPDIVDLVVLKRPLLRSEMNTESAAVTIRSPPFPPPAPKGGALVVLILAPPVRLKVPTFTDALAPAPGEAPRPELLTSINADVPITRLPAVICTIPASPVENAVIWSPAPPDRETSFVT